MSFFEKHRRVVITAIVTVVIFVIMGISAIPFKNSFFVTNVLNTVLAPFQSAVSGISNGIGGFADYLVEMKDLKAENDRLTSELAQLQHKYRSAEDYKTENEKLKEILAIQENSHMAAGSICAQIIGWSSDNWYNYYTIDKGSMHGIAVKDVVICTDGLVGHVSEVGVNWAKISTIIDSKASVGAKIIRSGDVTIVEGDFELEREGLCKMTFINKDAQIIVGDTVETSGLGENYPAGIALGKVVEIVSDVSGVSQYAVLEPYADFKNIKQVLVLK